MPHPPGYNAFGDPKKMGALAGALKEASQQVGRVSHQLGNQGNSLHPDTWSGVVSMTTLRPA